MKQITTKSGIKGYQCRLQDNYSRFEEFAGYSDNFNLAPRLGFKTALQAWQANPTIQGSTNPEDFCVVSPEPSPIGKEKMTYKVDYEGGSVAHYCHDKKEAYEVYEKFKTDYEDMVRLYEAPMPINDHDEIDWEIIECFDKEDETAPIGKEKLPQVTIENNEGDFCVYDETGHLVYDGFSTYEQASTYASEDGYEVVESISAPIGKEVENEDIKCWDCGKPTVGGICNCDPEIMMKDKQIYFNEALSDGRTLAYAYDEKAGEEIVNRYNEHPSLYRDNARLKLEMGQVVDDCVKYEKTIKQLRAENKELKEMLLKLMEVSARTTQNYIGFDGADELDNCIDKANQLLNPI